MITNGQDTLPALRIVAELFQVLNDREIRYCHWKSTHGLPRAMSGKTDLDILVDRGDSRRFKEVLYELDFKPFVSDPSKQFPAIEDYLGFDAPTGRLVHLHIHYRLVLGEQYVKNYYLPLEKPFLDHTTARWGVKVPAPELEIVVLTVRALLKYRDQDVARDRLGVGGEGGIPPTILREFEYLLEQTSMEAVGRALREHITFISPELVTTFLETIRTNPRDGQTLGRLRRQVQIELAPYQRYGWLRARAIYLRGMLTRQWPFDKIVRRIAPGLDKRKRPVTGGLTMAFVGADGAGKSTIIAHITKWLSWRLDVQTYYLGTSRPSAPTKVLKATADLARLGHSGCRRLLGEQSAAARLAEQPYRLLKNLRYLSEGRDRYRRYMASRRKAAQGTVIVYDRYPLQAVRIFNRTIDGPRIAATSNGHAGKTTGALARIEEQMYRKILPPEHVFVLHVSPDVSQQRKPEHKRELIEAKSQAIEQIARDDLNIVDVDAEQPLEQVLIQIKTALWRVL
jgi:thymidylate kinase